MTAMSKAMRRLQVVAGQQNPPRLRTIAKIAADLQAAAARHSGGIPVEADGSPWGNFLSHLNKAVRPYMDDINQAYEDGNLEPIVDILSDAMEDLLDSLADEFGYESEEGDENGEGDNQAEGNSAPAAAPVAPAAPGTTVIE